MKGVFSSASWLLLGHAGRIGSQLVGFSLIARLLTPADFGVVAIAMVVSNLAGLLRDMGTGPAAIRSADCSPAFYGGIYTLQLLISGTLALTIIAISAPLADFYRIESLQPVLVALATVFPLTALGAVHLIVLEKQERYRDVSVAELLSYLAGLLAAVILAFHGFGVESLALQAVVNAATQSLLLRRVARVRIVPGHPARARSALGGAVALTGYQLFNYLVRNADTAIAGRLAATSFVGAYSMATRVAQMPSQAIGMILSRLSVPLLSKSGLEPDQLARQVRELVNLALFASAAACLVLAALRVLLCSLLFGQQWVAIVAPQLQFLLPAAALTSVSALLVGIMTALGASSQLTRLGAVTAVVHLSAVVAALMISPQLLPTAVLLSSVCAFGFTVASTRALLRAKGVGAEPAMHPLPLLLILAYPWFGVGFAINESTEARPLGPELLEAGAILLLLAIVYLWRRGVSTDMRDGNGSR